MCFKYLLIKLIGYHFATHFNLFQTNFGVYSVWEDFCTYYFHFGNFIQYDRHNRLKLITHSVERKKTYSHYHNINAQCPSPCKTLAFQQIKQINRRSKNIMFFPNILPLKLLTKLLIKNCIFWDTLYPILSLKFPETSVLVKGTLSI